MSAVTSLLGFEVLEACDGLQCIDVYNQERTQLVCIFLDLQMPVADGYTAAAGIRALESREPGGPGGEAAPRVPVVVCTASCLDDPAEGGPAGQTVAQRALALGADGAVGKPLTVVAVQRILDTYAPTWRATSPPEDDDLQPHPPAPSPAASPAAAHAALRPEQPPCPPHQTHLGPPLPEPWLSPSTAPMSPMSPAALLAAAAAAAALSPLALHLSPFVWRGEQTEAAEGEAAAWSLRRRFPSLRDAGSAGPAFGGAVAMQSADARGRRAVSAAAGQRLQRRLSALSDAATSAAALWALRPPSRSLLQQQA